MKTLFRRFALVLLATLAFIIAGCQQHTPHSAEIEKLQTRAMEDMLVWDLLTSLTVDIGPRMAGTPADARAVKWAEERMNAMGFDRVWLERVTFPRWRRGFESASIVAPRLQPMAVTAIGGSPGTSGTLNARVVHLRVWPSCVQQTRSRYRIKSFLSLNE